MKYLLYLLLSIGGLPALAQQPRFAPRAITLPKELEFYDNQFSGLAISGERLLLMSESRLQDRAEAKLYAVRLTDLDRQLTDSAYVLPYQKLPIQHLAALRARMDSYEGLEAVLIDKDTVYFSVETATPAANCYLLRGRLQAAAVVLDTTFLLPLPKPLAPDGSHIYNAGFEALAKSGEDIVAFFEYNSFAGRNSAYQLDTKHLSNTSQLKHLAFSQVPFRLTDLTTTGFERFTGINYFFKGEGGDAVYRTPATDTASARLIRRNGQFVNYCRLVTVERKGAAFTWQPLWEFPERYRGYNWEGIAAYRGGYFIINDKYSPARPYRTTLLYLQAVN
ncbi:hypothetical protein [Hymenobacter psoromatis]|uniref:hypothetical protein n=1 Tax=Hymenobacter psoromatis TaxID=1484116 RepID=UPI001CC06C6D|nr:hypothetical protein [Hymenobacter psoromatis]